MNENSSISPKGSYSSVISFCLLSQFELGQSEKKKKKFNLRIINAYENMKHSTCHHYTSCYNKH